MAPLKTIHPLHVVPFLPHPVQHRGMLITPWVALIPASIPALLGLAAMWDTGNHSQTHGDAGQGTGAAQGDGEGEKVT